MFNDSLQWKSDINLRDQNSGGTGFVLDKLIHLKVNYFLLYERLRSLTCGDLRWLHADNHLGHTSRSGVHQLDKILKKIT